MKRAGFVVAVLVAMLAARAAAAAFTIWAARIAEGDLWVIGEVDEPNAIVTLDDSFSERADARGRFQFRIAYHPATCTVVVKTETQSRAVVVANCGQRGPAGPAGPPGAAAPVPEPPPAQEPPAAPPSEPPEVRAEAPPANAPQSEPPAGQVVACGPKAALYEGEKGFQMWVTRRGRSLGQNPLRPLSREAALVLQVTINGRVATAYGPDFSQMLRGGPPQQLEETTGPIEWSGRADGLPEVIQIVSESGADVLARLAFKRCGDVPGPAAREAKRPPPRRRPAPAAPAETSEEEAPARPLPQGAVPE